MASSLAYLLRRIPAITIIYVAGFLIMVLKNIKRTLSFVVNPTSSHVDTARKEFILNILLFGTILFCLVTLATSSIGFTIAFIQKVPYQGLSPILILVALCIFLVGYIFSKRGKAHVVAYILLGTYFFITTYTAYRWGPSVPQVLITYSLIIVMAGILISSRVALFTALAVSAIFLIFIPMQEFKMLYIDTTWRKTLPGFRDALTYSINFCIIALVSWLSNREIEKSLQRARRSEAALRNERDLLEVKVEERTKEIKQLQMEKTLQLYRFAEFGKISSGLFHDLATPLSLVSLNLQILNKKDSSPDKQKIRNVKTLLQRALVGTERLENYVKAAKKQIQNQETSEFFSLKNEIEHVLQILRHKAKEKRITIHLIDKKDIWTFGNPIMFNHIVTNLIVNALDAYDHIEKEGKKEIVITIDQKKAYAQLTIQDWGQGIKKELLTKIFEPFFTTKNPDRGTGLGLSICRNIIEKNFKGTITVTSDKKNGTCFTVTFLIKENSEI